MWTYDEKQLKEKNLPGASIKESACYECKIERAELFKSDVNKSEALILTFRALKEDRTARIPLFYKNKKGVEQIFNSKHINQLVYLLKIKHENLKTELDEEGKEIFPMIENRTVGVFLSYQGVNEVIDEITGEINYFNEYQIRGFYHSKSRKTTQEIIEKIEAPQTYEIWEKNFLLENKLREKKEQERGTAVIKQYMKSQNSINDDADFPF